LALRKRLNASWTSAGLQAFEDEALIVFLATGVGFDLAPAFLGDLFRFSLAAEGPGELLTRLTLGDLDLVRGLRVIFAMISIY
jgi:hypothetical protein